MPRGRYMIDNSNGYEIIFSIAVTASFVLLSIQFLRMSASNELSIYLEKTEEFKKLSESIHLLKKLYMSNKKEFDQINTSSGTIQNSQILNNILQNETLAPSIRTASKNLHSYFSSIASDYEKGTMSKRLALMLMYHPALNLFYQVGSHISFFYHPSQNNKESETLKKLCKQHKDGKIKV